MHVNHGGVGRGLVCCILGRRRKGWVVDVGGWVVDGVGWVAFFWRGGRRSRLAVCVWCSDFLIREGVGAGVGFKTRHMHGNSSGNNCVC